MTHTIDQSTNTNHSTEATQGARVEIYTSPFCGYCRRAKVLLDRKGIEYEEFGVMTNPSHQARMLKRSNGRTTVPQVFINGEHIGGSDDLFALDQTNELDLKLKL